MRVLAITIGTLVVLGILIVMTRIWGLSQEFKAYPHAFLQGERPYQVVQVANLGEAQRVVAEKPQAILWLDVRLSQDKVAFILAPSNDNVFLEEKRKLQEQQPQEFILKGGRLSEYPWQDIQKYFNNPPLLTEFYQHFPDTRFILNVVDNVLEIHHVVAKTLEDLQPDPRTLIQSDAKVILTAQKELKPTWVYGTSQPDLVRLMVFDSLFVLPAIPYTGDVYIAPFKLMGRPAFHPHVLEEMKRRQIPVFLGPIKGPQEYSKAQELGADGYIYENLDDLLQFVK